MRIHVAESVSISDPQDLTRLDMEVSGPSSSLDARLAAAGAGRSVEPGRARVSIEWLRRVAGAEMTADPAWHERFDAMLAHAQDAGWLSADRTWTAVHVVSGR